jgi:predicted PurR-regulated permease PerM
MEGTYGTIIFAIFGIPSPVLWGIIIMILSMVPLIGSNVIIVPAGLIQILTGQYIEGAVIILLGIAGIAVTQNIVRPYLQGGRSGLHPMIVLLSTLGGIAWLGIVGFLVGPMIASLFVAIWQQFGERYKEQLDTR